MDTRKFNQETTLAITHLLARLCGHITQQTIESKVLTQKEGGGGGGVSSPKNKESYGKLL